MSRLYSAAYRLYYWVFYRLAQLIAMGICEPKLRLGRRRHDNACDLCAEPCGSYAHEKLDFPIEDLDPESTSSREKIRAMLAAEYQRVCIECDAEVEREEEATA